MNAVEIEQAVSQLAEQPFEPAEFPFQFLEAFGNKATTVKRLRATGKSTTNKSDLADAILQRNNIHLAVSAPDQVAEKLQALIDSPATAKHKAKFALATDGQTVHAANLIDDAEPPLVCDYQDLGDHFGYFLALAGISTVKAIRENAFDIKATGRLNRLYVELLKHNEDWATAERREDLNHFFARLIFCFFAEDTGIFHGDGLFTQTVQQMTQSDGSDTSFVLGMVFRAMDVQVADRGAADLRPWANAFPYVNGGLFGSSRVGFSPPSDGDTNKQPDDPRWAEAHPTSDVPRFTKIARSYLLHIGSLDWTKINPDIFGSMIQAVADDAERGSLGMHYTSVPNILKVLNPLFLDDLRDKLDKAGDRPQALRHLRRRLARIRVFDPACGSGNFLVIAYKEMRKIEAEINERLGEPDRMSDIPETNFRGIEIRHFAAEIARLAIIIAKYQCDVLHRGERLALAEFLPLNDRNWITCGNALRLDWLSVCSPTGRDTEVRGDDLFEKSETPDIDFQNEGGETYICGNPPYLGSRNQDDEQREDLQGIFEGRISSWRSLDYVAGWFMKAADYGRQTEAATAFVSTNSICQGLQVPLLWEPIFKLGQKITFAHASFRWTNLASHNAGVTVAVIGMSNRPQPFRRLFIRDENDEVVAREVPQINAYLVPAADIFIEPSREAPKGRPEMLFGNMPRDGGALCLTPDERRQMVERDERARQFMKRYLGSEELIQGKERSCLWVTQDKVEDAEAVPFIADRMKATSTFRAKSKAAATRGWADRGFRFVQVPGFARETTIAVAGVSSERREYLPVDLLSENAIISNLLYGMYDAPLWNLALIASRLHLVWVATVCGKLKTDYRYSNTLGWNTFPVPALSEQNKLDLTRRAEEILLAREAHWPATIADLYDPEAMDRDYPDLRRAHDANDETLERIYLGRRFKNDTERLEHLFALYTKMTAQEQTSAASR